jgi:coenzyme F420-dependent glucose-6-phosphate dehydrogenase
MASTESSTREVRGAAPSIRPQMDAAPVLTLGYWLSSEEHHPAALIDHASAAEEAGFTTAMISDHLHPWTVQQGHSPFVWTVLGGIARSTTRLEVGTGVSVALRRMHPVALAHAAGTAAVLLPGRFFLGLGSGERLNEQVTGERWPRAAERRDALEEAIPIIRRLLQGDEVSHRGAWFTVEKAKLFTCPDAPPPIYVAASGKQTAKLAGRMADGLIGVDAAPETVNVFEASGGLGRPRVAQVHVCWAPDRDEAVETALRWFPNAAMPGEVLAELATPQQFGAVAAMVTAEQVGEKVVVGPDPADYRRAIERFVAAGFTRVYLHQIGPDQQGFLDFFRKEVAPLFAGAAADDPTGGADG